MQKAFLTLLVLSLIFITIICFSACAVDRGETTTSLDTTAQETETELQNAPLDQNQAGGVAFVILMKTLTFRNPDSMEIVSGTKYANRADNEYVVKLTIRAENGYGGMSVETYYINFIFLGNPPLDPSDDYIVKGIMNEEFDVLYGEFFLVY